ncbi:triacylglycerol lipase [Mycolicibacterium sp. BK556]|uniref:lipase family protein n=1 Tax=unclassified Mycolicibacterium TaxID=2636767 RepID=UPI00161B9B52|nr:MULTISPECIES: lipase family protein [unclassified Mycolicibacterium]MBB3606776.1 triacylglycerol lipase [Mycolicibacterium sp. BK556]MBB3636558.1 triacylglycerol lipase [Mycolicibacterium sp. BK607]MBB3754355.1 triacylglycerol lipase [Mycolicibacterium sp. BK634]
MHPVSAGAPSPEWIGRAPHETFTRGAHPALPADDPFYEPPAGFEHAEPGTVLRSRDVELGFLGLIPQRVRATQLLYRTTDHNGLPQATVTTVLIPTGHTPTQVRNVVSYQCAIDAVASRCFPSYALRRHAKSLGSIAQLEYLLIAAALAEGWVVSVPDHEGPNGMWGAPYEPGYAVLDGLRAALGFERFGLAKDNQIGLWGYSGGGLASAWAAEVHAEYAPELNIVGAVLGSPVGDLGHTFRRLNGSYLAALPALVVSALTKTYPDLHRVIEEHATEDGKALLRRLERMTTAEAVIRLFRTDMDNLVRPPLEDVLAMPEVQYVFDNIKLGKSVPDLPVLIVQAVHDSVIAVEDIDDLAHTYSAGGAQVTYHRDMFSEHMLLHPMSAPMTLRWLTDRFNGRPIDEHIVRTKWPTLLNPMTYAGMMRLGGIVARVVTGGRVPFRPL